MNTVEDIKRRIMAMCPASQAPMLNFELRMLMATMETDSLMFINEHWRPIAEERDQLQIHLDAALAKPARSAKADADPESLQARFDALSTENRNLRKQLSNQQDRADDLQAELIDLKEAHKKLQADCDELLADARPVRAAS